MARVSIPDGARLRVARRLLVFRITGRFRRSTMRGSARYTMRRRPIIAAVMALTVCPVGRAQNPASRPAAATQAAASAPAGGYQFRAAELSGKARVAPVGTDPNLDEGWTAVK